MLDRSSISFTFIHDTHMYACKSSVLVSSLLCLTAQTFLFVLNLFCIHAINQRFTHTHTHAHARTCTCMNQSMRWFIHFVDSCGFSSKKKIEIKRNEKEKKTSNNKFVYFFLSSQWDLWQQFHLQINKGKKLNYSIHRSYTYTQARWWWFDVM